VVINCVENGSSNPLCLVAVWPARVVMSLSNPDPHLISLPLYNMPYVENCSVVFTSSNSPSSCIVPCDRCSQPHLETERDAIFRNPDSNIS
jgi:hypothetical protein